MLAAYSLADPNVGYCQGMGFLAAFLLFYLKEVEAFEVFVLMLHVYGLRGIFAPGLPLLARYLECLQKLIELHLPNLWRHFQLENVDCSMFASQWLMTIFSYSFPPPLTCRLWDSFFLEGVTFLFKANLAILKLNQSVLLSSNFEEILYLLKDLVGSAIDADVLLTTAHSIDDKHINDLLSRLPSYSTANTTNTSATATTASDTITT
eukprot:GHVT01035950.1.p1 GENE.GHVT01035950.1~~GHVT01035950.1.p1  ORF type:complete len:207 (+),score=24.91 GHVT01035950.1:349-969(+)